MSTPPNITLEDDRTRTAIISLGSNRCWGELTPREILEQAAGSLAALSGRPVTLSSFYETEPVDCAPGTPPFVNAVALMDVARDLAATELMQGLLRIEQRFGRTRASRKNSPRSLDLDLVCLGEMRREDPDLVLPHPRAPLRRFVLQPLAELAPELRLPGQAVSVRELLAGLPQFPGVKLLAD